MHPENYYSGSRSELLDVLLREPRRLLDVGCASGGASMEARRRWPNVNTTGVETVPEVAAIAAHKLDRVICGSAEELDLAKEGVAEIDTVLLGDVLEHMVDPWAFLIRLRDVLTPDAVIASSVPNIANIWMIEELANGRFEYESEGLLDSTHLRFFTRRSIQAMFAKAGYEIHEWRRVLDGRSNDILRNKLTGSVWPQWMLGRMKGPRVRIGGVDRAAFDDLRTIQYIVRATPR